MEFLSRQTCQELKEAEYPQRDAAFYWTGFMMHRPMPESEMRCFHVEPHVACPSLDELIADLGDHFDLLEAPAYYVSQGPRFEAEGRSDNHRRTSGECLSPLQAVAALWLAVKGKKPAAT